MQTIDRFSGYWRCLSNFSPAVVILDGLDYPSVEHAYQAAKTADLDDRLSIRDAATPARAKQMGRMLDLRPDWEDVKVGVMLGLLQQKFADPVRAAQLEATGDAQLVEGNTWGDRYWGQCPVGVGENMLGELLMIVRQQRRL